MANIGTYVADFVANVTGFVQNVEKASAAVEGLGATITKSLLTADAIEQGFKKTFQVISDVMTKVITETANYGDEILAMSQKTGVATETLGGLVFAFQQGNASQEDLSAGLRGLSKNLEKASEGSKEQAAAFQFLDIATKDSSGHLRPMNDILLDVADRFQTLPDGAEKAALAVAIFGKSGAALIPTLNEGSQGIREQTALAEHFGAVMSGEAAEAGDRFNDALGETDLAIRGLSFAIGEQLLPILTVLIRGMNEYIASATQAVRTSTLLELALRAVTSPFGMMITSLKQSADNLKTGADLAFEYSERLKALVGVQQSFADSQKAAAAAAAELNKRLKEDAKIALSEQEAIWNEFVRQNVERDKKELERQKQFDQQRFFEAQAALQEVLDAEKQFDQDRANEVKAMVDEILGEEARLNAERAAAINAVVQEIQDEDKRIHDTAAAIYAENQKVSKSFEVALGNITSDFAKAFTDVLFSGKSFADAMQGLFQQTAKSLFNAFLVGLFDPLSKKLAEAGKQIGDIVNKLVNPSGGFLNIIGGAAGIVPALGPIGALFGAGFGIGTLLFGRKGPSTPAQPTSQYFDTNPFGGGVSSGFSTTAMGGIPTYGPDSPAYLASQRPNLNVTVNGSVLGFTSVNDLTRAIAAQLSDFGFDSGFRPLGER